MKKGRYPWPIVVLAAAALAACALTPEEREKAIRAACQLCAVHQAAPVERPPVVGPLAPDRQSEW